MFNNINDNSNDFLQNANWELQSNVIKLNTLKSAAQNYNKGKTNPYVDKTEISSNAIELFQKDCDIKKFNKIAVSDQDDLSHIERMSELFNQGVVDAYEDDVFAQMVNNTKLLDDLEL
jgi:hypothetical protein